MSATTKGRPVPDVDHLTRDYRGIREQLIQLITRSGSRSSERSAADLGMVVLEALAYQLDHLAYAGDRVASEGFLRTARSRQSVLDRAQPSRTLRMVIAHLVAQEFRMRQIGQRHRALRARLIPVPRLTPDAINLLELRQVFTGCGRSTSPPSAAATSWP